jgi:hypothetical protein
VAGWRRFSLFIILWVFAVSPSTVVVPENGQATLQATASATFGSLRKDNESHGQLKLYRTNSEA